MKRILSAIFLASIMSFAFPQENINTEISVDWTHSSITIVSRYYFNEPFTPSFRLKGERELEKAFPVLLKKSLLDIRVDSFSRMMDYIIGNPALLAGIDRLSSRATRTRSTLSDELTYLENSYLLHVYPYLVDLFVRHSVPNRIRTVLEPVPSGNFTGILIYAKGLYDVYGENTRDHLVPCLFPKIRNYQSEVLLEKENIPPEILKSKGMFLYSDNHDDSSVTNRVGLAPLRIQAFMIFGKYRTDIVLSEDDTYRLLAQDRNIQLLMEGKTAVILDLP